MWLRYRSDVDRPDPDHGVSDQMYPRDSCGVREQREIKREKVVHDSIARSASESAREKENARGRVFPGAEQAKSEYCVAVCWIFAFDRKGRMHVVHGHDG